MRNRLIWGVAVLFMSLASLAGCQEEGPAERAGKGVDKAARDLKDAVNPPGPAEKAGRAVDDALNK
jgi:predicted small lipoprotein YifL